MIVRVVTPFIVPASVSLAFKLDLRLTMTAFETRETRAQSIARLDRAEAIYFQECAADNSTLAASALDTGAPVETTARLQRAAGFFASRQTVE
jgi:hypothetical protein